MSSMYAPERFTDVGQVSTHLAHMCGRGATYAMICDALADIFNRESDISTNEDRERAFRIAADSLADAVAEMEFLDSAPVASVIRETQGGEYGDASRCTGEAANGRRCVRDMGHDGPCRDWGAGVKWRKRETTA
jgi:hypothetical protein